MWRFAERPLSIPDVFSDSSYMLRRHFCLVWGSRASAVIFLTQLISMTYKRWRILIAEEQPALQFIVGQCLKELGYRALTPVRSLRELLGVTHYSCEPFEHFDLLLINGELLAAGIDPVRFFVSNSQIRHGVIYDARRGQPRAESIYANQRRQLSLIHTPDRETLVPLLEQLDGQAISRGIRDVY